MRDDLLDAKAAVDWAVSQVPKLQERVISWRREKPYSIVIDADSEPGKKLYRICDFKPLDPFVHAWVGATVHSIRSSIDLLACALAARNGHLDARDTYFPIWKTEADFLNAKSEVLKKIKRLSQVDQVIIKSLRPYPGGNNLLCALHDMDLTRKHRRLLNTFVSPRGVFFEGFTRDAITIPSQMSLDQEAILISTPATDADGNVYVNLHVAFDETGISKGIDFTGPISDFARLAHEIIDLFV